MPAIAWGTVRLCDKTDVLRRVSDVGLMAGSSEDSEKDTLVEQKIELAKNQLQLAILSRIQRAGLPEQVDPHQLLTRLTNHSILKECAVTWTVYAMMEDGETRTRFNFEDAADALAKAIERWRKEKMEALDTVWPLLLFDVDGNGTVTTLERAFTSRFSSVRVFG